MERLTYTRGQHYTRYHNLVTHVLLTVVVNWAIDVLLETAFTDEDILAITQNKQNVVVWKSAPVDLVKQRDVSAYNIFTKRNTQNVDMKNPFEAKYNQRSTIKQSNIAGVAKQSLLEPL